MYHLVCLLSICKNCTNRQGKIRHSLVNVFYMLNTIAIYSEIKIQQYWLHRDTFLSALSPLKLTAALKTLSFKKPMNVKKNEMVSLFNGPFYPTCEIQIKEYSPVSKMQLNIPSYEEAL